MPFSTAFWRKIFLFCIGLFLAAAFCMKWMENDLRVNGEKFTIMGLELFYSKEKVMAIMTGLDDHVRSILSYHLHFDFVFMAGVFPGIAALCILAGRKVAGNPGKLLFALAVLLAVAWVCDIYENLCLLKWMKAPVIGNEFGLYHFIVAAKWIIVLSGIFVSGAVFLFVRKKN
ncbi:MAG TPA: hypothetical protein VIZ28_11495 [Chitinophagaceae bacterium]